MSDDRKWMAKSLEDEIPCLTSVFRHLSADT